jgi:hypothetical protein
LPTIKSENSTSPGVSTPATVKLEEGVALPRESVNTKENTIPSIHANGTASAVVEGN